MLDLDNLELFKSIDPNDMLHHITGFPEQCRQAWQIAKSIALPEEYRQIRNIVVLGLGGSAIGGDLVRTLVAGECPLPLIVNRDYALPAFVGPDSLVIASSYSGHTEETLMTSADALKAGAKIVAVATGGELARWAKQHHLPVISFSYKAQPRAAVGYSFSLVLGVLASLGYIKDKSQDMDEAISVMKVWQSEICETIPAAQNRAKQIAQWIFGGLPIVYGAGYLSEIARRWKGQFNENAKAWGFFEQMPELNHNAVVGYACPSAVRDVIRVVLLRSSLDHPRNQRRFEVTEDILKRQDVSTQRVNARGVSALAQMLSVVHLGDYVSYYLAMLYGSDPTPVDTITYLKEQLAR
jgi:glucose/mannose-6-phosphate isomerase